MKGIAFIRNKKNYKAILVGGIMVSVLAIMFRLSGGVIVDSSYVSQPVYFLVHTLSFALCWWVISTLLSKFPIYEVVGVMGLLVVASAVEFFMKFPDNPVTIPLLILFWLGVAYLILPEFFKKYKVAILSVYGCVLLYFFIFRAMPNYFEEHHQNFLKFLLIPIPIFAALWGYEQWRWLRILKADKAKAELTLLKNQINPHFFFNTLNNLYGLAVEKSDQAPAMILKLSDIMRYTIYEGESDYVALEDEGAYLEDYIELHKIRYQKQVSISFHKDLSHAHKIAPLLLIIPLENAFKHGVESLTENAFIDLKLNTTPTCIYFTISNNYEVVKRKEEGIGLANLKKRLALIYPNRHKLEIAQTVDRYTISLEIESE